MSDLSGLDARSLYQSRFEEWRQDPAQKDKNLSKNIAKASQQFADSEMQNAKQRAKDWLDQENAKYPNLGKQILGGISSIGRGIGNFAINTGIWKDFNPDKGIFGKDEDGKRTFDLGQAVGNGVGNIGRGLGFASQFLPQQEMAENTNNKVAQGVATTVGTAALKSGNPWAALYGGALLAGQKLGINNSGSDTGNKAVDLGNSALALIPGLGLLGKKAGQYNEDALVNSSHSYNNIGDQARKNSNGRFLINGNGIRNQIKDANFKTYIASNDILRPGKLDIIGAQDPKYYIAAQNELNGGYDQVGVAKQGAILQFSRKILSKNKILTRQKGGLLQKKPRTLDELVDYVEQQNPPFWERMSGQDTNEIESPFGDGGYSTLIMGWTSVGNGMAEVFPQVQYDDTHHLRYIEDWREAYALAKRNGDTVRMTEEEAENFTTNYKKASKLKHVYDSILPQYTETFTGIFKEGGKVNVIPEGALHKNKHHLEDVDEKFGDGSITTKGIPVIVESEGGEVIQQAEVERQEIIFRLEVTKKLEELSKKHTDEAAIEAGKLLTYEILYNTEDKTNNMI